MCRIVTVILCVGDFEQEQVDLQRSKQRNLKELKTICETYKTNCAVSVIVLLLYNFPTFIIALQNFLQKSRDLMKCEVAAVVNKINTSEKQEKRIRPDISKLFTTRNIKKSILRPYLLSSVVVGAVDSKTGVLEPIPEPPPIPEPEPVLDAASQLNALGEQTFASLGLGGWTPVGLVQNCFEYLHVTLGIPWWEAIVIGKFCFVLFYKRFKLWALSGTIVIRTLMLPLVIIAQRNAARMNNYLPQMQAIQLKLTEARQTGNELDAARYSQELMLFMREKGLNPLKNMVVPLAQMPIFISFFIALREMATTPVESLKTGGLFWFQDLTVPDQYFAMPIITSLTLWATIEVT